MRTFLVATGTIFGLLTLAHVARVIDDEAPPRVTA
jgi:hypothetical protein